VPACCRPNVVRKLLATLLSRGGEKLRVSNGINEPLGKLSEACRAVTSLRSSPLLILYYPDYSGLMSNPDVDYCYRVLREGGLDTRNKVSKLDVLVHTFGGDPTAAYRLAKCIRYFADHVTFLVPEHAYSAGTLLCLSGDIILFGHNAGISPIDVSLETENELIELTAIDYFMSFVRDSQRIIQQVLHEVGVDAPGSVGSDLLCRLVDQVQAIKVGSYYRQRTLTGHYAEELIDRYMLQGKPNAQGVRNRILHQLLFSAPAHEFHVDCERAKDYGLIVDEMSVDESDATKEVVRVLELLEKEGDICLAVHDWQRMPFFYYSPQEAGRPATSHSVQESHVGHPTTSEPFGEEKGDGSDAGSEGETSA
jgi:hypothetical protein